ncbi:MAG: ATP-binding cassette domain-containing protein [Bacilli bacterium]|nr:ATP-binding cassette domain-containing protein [Bacilli bacterium]
MVKCIDITGLNYINIFKNLSFSIEKNNITSLSGPNNSGKTVLLKILSKQINTDGTINVLDKNINDYKITDYYKIVKTIIPLEEIFYYDTVEEELNYYINQLFLSKEETNKRLKNIQKNLFINKIKKKQIKELTDSEKVILQLALAVASMPKIILIDDLTYYLEHDDMKKIISYFRYLIKNYDVTILINSTRLEDILETDNLYILSDSEIILQGKPLEILQKDNILNKAGIKVPFMIDLSVKLKDYNLIDEVELDINRMIKRLWN